MIHQPEHHRNEGLRRLCRLDPSLRAAHERARVSAARRHLSALKQAASPRLRPSKALRFDR